ncbi:MAG: rhodanese-like domain-containing protein [Antricoccus sp.]
MTEPKPLKRGFQQMCDEAMAEVETLSVADAAAKFDDPDVLFVDIRDPRELDREGQIPGAFNANRGMLEFWVDPDSPYYHEELGQGKEMILYCAGGLRSALATKTLQDMGVPNVKHIGGGFGAWKAADKPTGERERRQRG